MVRSLPIHKDVIKSGSPNLIFRKLILGTFNLLKAQDIWVELLDKIQNQAKPQSDRIDIPGGNSHGFSLRLTI